MRGWILIQKKQQFVTKTVSVVGVNNQFFTDDLDV